ncbi:hypothetical protein KCP75_19110 [Salmonella enterica subsp. enterica]|nr:hypothetical protein KCP75_19110 [Salmonella enterica subsp. enterica]
MSGAASNNHTVNIVRANALPSVKVQDDVSLVIFFATNIRHLLAVNARRCVSFPARHFINVCTPRFTRFISGGLRIIGCRPAIVPPVARITICGSDVVLAKYSG